MTLEDEFTVKNDPVFKYHARQVDRAKDYLAIRWKELEAAYPPPEGYRWGYRGGKIGLVMEDQPVCGW